MNKSINSLTKGRIINRILQKVRDKMPIYYHYDDKNGLKISVKDTRLKNKICDKFPYFIAQDFYLEIMIEKLPHFENKDWGKYNIYEKLPSRPKYIIKWDKGELGQVKVKSIITNSFPTSSEGEVEFRLVKYSAYDKKDGMDSYDYGTPLFRTNIESKDRRFYRRFSFFMGACTTLLLGVLVGLIMKLI